MQKSYDSKVMIQKIWATFYTVRANSVLTLVELILDTLNIRMMALLIVAVDVDIGTLLLSIYIFSLAVLSILFWFSSRSRAAEEEKGEKKTQSSAFLDLFELLFGERGFAEFFSTSNRSRTRVNY
jgi:hypothetical protein